MRKKNVNARVEMSSSGVVRKKKKRVRFSTLRDAIPKVHHVWTVGRDTVDGRTRTDRRTDTGHVTTATKRRGPNRTRYGSRTLTIAAAAAAAHRLSRCAPRRHWWKVCVRARALSPARLCACVNNMCVRAYGTRKKVCACACASACVCAREALWEARAYPVVVNCNDNANE